jgi:hypothetical protein
MKPTFDVGDLVSVHFHGALFTLCRSAKVLYVPTASGDGWRFEDLETGAIHAVSEPCTVSKKADAT